MTQKNSPPWVVHPVLRHILKPLPGSNSSEDSPKMYVQAGPLLHQLSLLEARKQARVVHKVAKRAVRREVKLRPNQLQRLLRTILILLRMIPRLMPQLPKP